MIPRGQMLLLPLKMRHFFIQMVSDSKCPHTEEFFSFSSARGSKTNRANEKGAVSFEVIDEHRLKPWSWSAFANRINFKLFQRGKEEFALSVDKQNSREKDDFVLEDLSGTSESFSTELFLITEEKRLIKVAEHHLQRNDIEGEGNFFFLFSILGRARFEDSSLSLSKLRSK